MKIPTLKDQIKHIKSHPLLIKVSNEEKKWELKALEFKLNLKREMGDLDTTRVFPMGSNDEIIIETWTGDASILSEIYEKKHPIFLKIINTNNNKHEEELVIINEFDIESHRTVIVGKDFLT
ncbi:MAG: hypothetical protein OXE77_00075 [Flavobacteriaceae bacterium]|nr:hypothetical protein [Flavobacteriaceae bacterium]MCY4267010.1 hypothetical protein [Flavobacteriaceae bacterium]